jgi:hypothetical protein
VEKPVKKKLVEVIWLDADCAAGWQPDDPKEDQKHKGMEMKCYGLLVSGGTKQSKFVTISFGYNQEAGEWLGKQRIPMGMVLKINTIKSITV